MVAQLISQPEVFATSWLEAASAILIAGFLGGAYHHIECQEDGCHRLGRFRHEHRKLCHRHHPGEAARRAATRRGGGG